MGSGVGGRILDDIRFKDLNFVVLDEDDMVSDSDQHVPTQQSVKAYVDLFGGTVTNTGTLTDNFLLRGNGGVDIDVGNIFMSSDGNDLTIPGNLTVNGTVVTLDTETLLVEDKNIELGVVTTPTDLTADGGGITLLGGVTNKTIIWTNATDSWDFNQDINLDSGLSYKINGTDILNSTTLGSSVVNSSLTSVGTLSSLTVSGVFNDSSGDPGTSGQVLSSTVTGTDWIDNVSSVTLQDAYDNGQSITTTTVLGPVILDNTGSTRATLQLVPGTVPTTSLVSGQIYSDGNDLYIYDSVRGKFLSGSERFGFGLNGAADNEYMRVAHASDTNAAWIIPYDATITHITAFATGGLATKGFEIQNESGTVLVAFNLTASEFDGTQDVDIPAGTHLRSFIVATGGSVNNSAVSVFIRRRV